MPVIRILHASDLHISDTPNTTSPFDKLSPGNLWDAARNRNFASTCNKGALLAFADLALKLSDPAQTPNPIKAVIITGDIATTGMEDDLRPARRFLFSRPRSPIYRSFNKSWEPTLGALEIPVWILPGNHDRYQWSKATIYKPGGRLFDDLFQNYWSGPVQPYQPSLIEPGICVQVIGADFNLQDERDYDGTIMQGGMLNRLAQGRVYPVILGELIRTTSQLRFDHKSDDHLIVLWAVHFPPKFPHIEHTMKLIAEDDLIRAANQCNVAVIMCGHTHEPICYRLPDMSFEVCCAGTTSQDHAPLKNHCQIINLTSCGDGGISIEYESYTFDRKHSTFEKVL